MPTFISNFDSCLFNGAKLFSLNIGIAYSMFVENVLLLVFSICNSLSS